MPTLHRISVFRDDVVFLIQLYQRWLYPIDKTRPNEFGQAKRAVIRKICCCSVTRASCALQGHL